MSCFIVSDKLINDTLNFINHHTKGEDFGRWITRDVFDDILSHYDQNPTKSDFLQFLGDYILSNNIDSWNARYSKDNTCFDGFNYKYHYQSISIAQFLKNIDCIDYQCCEVEGYYQGQFYKNLMYIRKQATYLIDGYEQAKWSY